MATTLAIKTPVAIPAANINKHPMFYEDEIMAPGSAFLFDGSRQQPVDLNNGTLIPNVAAKTAGALLGNTSAAATSAYIRRGAGFTGNVGLAELSLKGAIHGIISQVNHNDTGSQYLTMPFSSQLRDYFYARRNDKWFTSIWGENTRVCGTGFSMALFAMAFYQTGHYLCYAPGAVGSTSNQIRPSSGTLREGARLTTTYSNVLGKFIKNNAWTGTDGDPSGNATIAKGETGNFMFALGGGVAAYSSSSMSNKCPSMAVERVYVENLTASGNRSYAEVDAIDIEIYNRAHSIGGAFYGDTHTDPATLP